MSERSLQLYDTTLRDDGQQEDTAPTVEDRLAVARHLDAVGVDYIEGGWPGVVPRDTEFFRRARTGLDLKHAELAAFGTTRGPATNVSVDPWVRALLAAETPVVTLEARSHTGHLGSAPYTSLAENLAMVGGTVRHLVHAGRRVFLNVERYFHAYRANRRYALEVVLIAAEAGAETIVLCDTGGGRPSEEVGAIVAETIAVTGASIGVHCPDKTGCAVANTMAAVDAGAVHVQGTAPGYGGRRWGAVGVEEDTVTASWRALVGSFRDVLLEDVATGRGDVPLASTRAN